MRRPRSLLTLGLIGLPIVLAVELLADDLVVWIVVLVWLAYVTAALFIDLRRKAPAPKRLSRLFRHPFYRPGMLALMAAIVGSAITSRSWLLAAGAGILALMNLYELGDDRRRALELRDASSELLGRLERGETR